jgi:hypothetical protein
MRNLEFNSKYQKIDSKTYLKYETNELNSYQNYLYKRALYGIKSLSEEELKTMCTAKQKRIKSVNYRAQQVLNIYKHKITKQLTDKFFSALFPKSPIAKSLEAYNDIGNDELNKLSFKDLGIEKTDIVKVFVEEGILPANFYNLTVQDDPKFLPSLKK